MNDTSPAPEADQATVATAVKAALEVKAEARNKLVSALAKAKLNFGKIEKNREARVTYGYEHAKAGQLAYVFRYADLAEINEKTEKQLAENDLIVTHELVVRDNLDYVKTSLLHAGGGVLENHTQLIQTDKGQAGYAKAQTFAQRYGVRLLLNLAAEDDSDAEPENTEARDVRPSRAEGFNADPVPVTGKSSPVPPDPEYVDEYVKRIRAAFDNQDPLGAFGLFDELTAEEQTLLWRNGGFTHHQKQVLRDQGVVKDKPAARGRRA